jgi:MFS family permease
MNIKKQGIGILIVAMSLATAWAIRGQFGHEQGAAWAGAIGGLALVLVSQRKDWYNKMVLVALASAIGWGAGGMISYGKVVGYGHADNFINAFYGLSMLFVIGALFGLLGGGLVGLVLDSTEKNKVKWGTLIAEMVAGGLIAYFFLIEQIGFKMTPPRSEAWAIIFGSGLAMLLHMAREKRNSAIRVAIYSALGGGFGFAFGNFLQVVGNVMEIPFNMWNVMEYSIGFFGGSGMAYGVYSSKWPIDESKPKKWVNRIALFVITVFIPLIVYRETLAYEHLLKRLGEISNIESIAFMSTTAAAVILVLVAVFLFWKLRDGAYKKKEIALFLFVYLSSYIVMSYVVTGLFAGKMAINHHLYLLNIILIFVLFKKGKFHETVTTTGKIDAKKWFVYLLAILIVIALLALIAINTHGELSGDRNRF